MDAGGLRRGARGESARWERLRGGRVRAQAGSKGRERARGSASRLGTSWWGRGVRGDSARG